MTWTAADPINAEGDDLYAIYRSGIIRRHIANNGRFLESIALESVDDFRGDSLAAGGPHVELTHSVPNGSRGPNLRIRIPKSACRFSQEVDLDREPSEGEFQIRDQLWVPLVLPVKYPGMLDPQQGEVRAARSPWLPQPSARREYTLHRQYFVASSSRADNPGYYGGMALAAFSLEHLHGVSQHSLTYARKLVEGFFAMEMNGANGFLIRYDRWHPRDGEVKKIRGAGAEELLGIMLGLMFYLKAEAPDHPMYDRAVAFRKRVLDKVSRQGSAPWSLLEHPFMVKAYPVKHVEWPLYVSSGAERGREWLYRNILTESAGDSRIIEGDFFDYALFLTSMILVLEGGLPQEKKKRYAEIFMRDFIKAAYLGGPHIEDLKFNAYMGVVGFLCNKYLSATGDSRDEGPLLRSCWQDKLQDPDGNPITIDHIGVWREIAEWTEERIANCRSLQNEKISFSEEHHWQHNLPLFTITNEGQPYDRVDPIWRGHNPHRRIGAHFEWHHRNPQWFRGGLGNFLERAIGWDGPAHDEESYNSSPDKRFGREEYLKREVSGFRRHRDTQVEGSGVGLFFLRMLLSHIDPDRYPPPKLGDRDVLWPVLPFRGVEPLEPKFLHLTHSYRGAWDDWKIGGDKDLALDVASLPVRSFLVTATATEEERLQLDTWRLTQGGFQKLASTRKERFDQVVVCPPPASSGSAETHLAVVDRGEEDQIIDDHFLRVGVYRVLGDGRLDRLSSSRVSGVHRNAAERIGGSMLDRSTLAVIFKTRHKYATVKILGIDLQTGAVSERAVIEAEEGSGHDRREVKNFVWTGCTRQDVVISAYTTYESPYHRLRIFSRPWDGARFGTTSFTSAAIGEERPVGATVIQRDGKDYLVVASYYPHRTDGFEWHRLSIQSWEVGGDGRMVHRGGLEHGGHWDKAHLYRRSGHDFDRLRIAPAHFEAAGEFLISGKDKIGSGKGLALLYGRLDRAGRPWLVDWNCLGSGSDDSVKMVSLAGEARLNGVPGVAVATKDQRDGLYLSWWRYGEDFRLDKVLRRDPPGLVEED